MGMADSIASLATQRKHVLNGLHELVASDQVLRSLCYNASMYEAQRLVAFTTSNPLVPCDWRPIDPTAQVINELLAERNNGPPGLVVVRLSDPTEELCLELECISDVTGIHIILVSPYGQPTLEDNVEMRGDLSISGIGPKVAEILPTLRAWSESYGWAPRCYHDTWR